MSTDPSQNAIFHEPQPVAKWLKPRTVQLLVSVRDATEARLALRAGVDWIDLKEPSAGPLGAADPKVANEVGRILVTHQLRSAALGELRELDESLSLSLASAFPTVKVGLTGTSQTSDWKQRLQGLADILSAVDAQLVPVIYADWRECDAPMPEEIAAFCSELDAKYVLLDTYTKRGSDLFSWISCEQIHSLASRLGQSSCGMVLAGSVKYEMLDVLMELPIQAIGVRGAVCSGDRSGSICPQKLQSWVHKFNSL